MKAIKGSCHCKAVEFEAQFAGEIETSKCNCSICRKTRFWKTLVPADAFKIVKGQKALVTYMFGSKSVEHCSCGNCGVKVFGTVSMEDTNLVAISVPCLDLEPELLAKLPVSFEDGLHDAYENEPGVLSYL